MPRGLFVILAGGRGSRLSPLTETNPKCLLRFGPHGRVIDFPLYNCLAAEEDDVVVVTQYLEKQVELYLKVHWRGAFTMNGRKLHVLASKKAGPGGFKGTAHALERALAEHGDGADFVAVMAGDNICRIDMKTLIGDHLSAGKAVTMAALRAEPGGGRGMGRILPANGAPGENLAEAFSHQAFGADPSIEKSVGPLYSIFINVFSTDALIGYFGRGRRDDDFQIGRRLLPDLAARGEARYFHFTGPGGGDGFWRDFTNLHDYWRVHMDLIENGLGELKLSPVRGMKRPPVARLNLIREYVSGRKRILNSMVSNNARIGRALVEDSVVGPGVYIEDGASVRRSVLLDGTVVKRDTDIAGVLTEPKITVCPDRLSAQGQAGVHRMDGPQGPPFQPPRGFLMGKTTGEA